MIVAFARKNGKFIREVSGWLVFCQMHASIILLLFYERVCLICAAGDGKKLRKRQLEIPRGHWGGICNKRGINELLRNAV